MLTLLTLKRASKSRPDGEWSDDDYDVFDGDRLIGRILLVPQAPEGGATVLNHHGAGRAWRRPRERLIFDETGRAINSGPLSSPNGARPRPLSP
jgi:hypothetical protein